MGPLPLTELHDSDDRHTQRVATAGLGANSLGCSQDDDRTEAQVTAQEPGGSIGRRVDEGLAVVGISQGVQCWCGAGFNRTWRFARRMLCMLRLYMLENEWITIQMRVRVSERGRGSREHTQQSERAFAAGFATWTGPVTS